MSVLLVSPTRTPEAPPPPSTRAPGAAVQKCRGECGQVLPLSSFDIATGRKGGRRGDCKVCRRKRRGPRGKEGQQAQALEKRLADLLTSGDFTSPSLANVLSRAITEVRQIGATGPALAGHVREVHRAIKAAMCRTVAEVMEETGLSRWAVDRALRQLVAEGKVEAREGFAEEPGRPATEYFPAGASRDDDVEEWLHRAAHLKQLS